MRSLIFSILVLSLAACVAQDSLPLLDKAAFETTVDGRKTTLYTLKSGNGVIMQVTNFGARVISIWVPDKNGKYDDIAIGYENIDRYINNTGERFLGCVVGRYANRIAKGHFAIVDSTLNQGGRLSTLEVVEKRDENGNLISRDTLDMSKSLHTHSRVLSMHYQLPINNNGQTLHGGLKGLDMVVWDVKEASDTEIKFSYTSKDGDDGFPGNVTIDMTYTLTPQNEFRIDYQAVTDKSTVINLSNHTFFNLKGEANGTITDHILTINASHTTPVDSVLIPVGEIAPVDDTPFDFRKPTAIGERINLDNQQLKNGLGYDHNWVLDNTTGKVALAATLYEPVSGRVLEVYTDQPGLQFYSGNFFDGTYNGKYGKPIAFRETLALETQKFPDSPNHPNFPSTRLNPGETYTHTCIYRFLIK